MVCKFHTYLCQAVGGESGEPTGDCVETGPDGGIYILDWHDQNICGNEIKFANSARVYRIMPNGVKGPKAFDLEKLSDVELVEMQAHSNDWYVRQSRTILHHRTISGKLNKSSVHSALSVTSANQKELYQSSTH